MSSKLELQRKDGIAASFEPSAVVAFRSLKDNGVSLRHNENVIDFEIVSPWRQQDKLTIHVANCTMEQAMLRRRV